MSELWRLGIGEAAAGLMRGDFTAFSQVAPFVLHRRRAAAPDHGDRYHIDHVQGGKRVVIAYDGAVGWQENPWSGMTWRHRITGLDLQVLKQDVDFVNPLFDYAEKGYAVELVGRTDFEGQEVIQVDLTRPGGAEEKWYLDPETYLEVARDATGSDLGGQAFPQRKVSFRQACIGSRFRGRLRRFAGGLGGSARGPHPTLGGHTRWEHTESSAFGGGIAVRCAGGEVARRGVSARNQTVAASASSARVSR